MTLKLNGTTSGSVSLDAPATGSNVSFTLPGSTGSSGQLLSTNGAGVLSFVNGGKILQVVSATTATQVSTTSTTYVTTNLTASITPASTASKVLVFAQMPAQKSTDNIFSGARVRLFRGTVSGTALATNEVFAAGANPTATITFAYLDSPATASSQTYTVGLSTGSGLTTVASCPSGLDASIVLLEVAA